MLIITKKYGMNIDNTQVYYFPNILSSQTFALDRSNLCFALLSFVLFLININ